MSVKGFLQAVLSSKREEIAHARGRISEATLRSDAEQTEARASFAQAMEAATPENPGIIAEIKKASPSKGDIRADLKPGVQAEAYHKGGAAAVSVLTEPRYFKGSLGDLKEAGKATDLPLLRKDFVISAYQIYEAKRAGASSVLLITTLLSTGQQADYTHLIRELGMEPLVEINSEWEFEQAFHTKARVVGINNRNLTTLEVDPDAARRVAAIFPPEIISVAASGIASRADMEPLLQENISNFLIGESIVRSPDPIAFIKELRGDRDGNE